MSPTTTLPLPPGVVGLIGLVALILLTYGALSLVTRDRPGPVWSGLSAGWLAAAVVGALVWVGLFGLVLVAAVNATLGMIENPTNASLGLGTLLVALLGAPFLIWTTVLKHQTLRYQKEGHMTDRISKAVEQLGAEKTVKKVVGEKAVETTEPNLEVRIGAILSLERIAQDSTIHDKGRDHARVMEILCAYIRHNAPASSAQDSPFGEWEPFPDDASEDSRAARVAKRKARLGLGFGDGKVAQWARSLGPPRADVAEALKVLGRRNRAQLLVEAAWPYPPEPGTPWPFDGAPHLPDDPTEAPITAQALAAYKESLARWKRGIDHYSGYRLDLRKTNLQGADLSEGWFQGAELAGARLDGAKLGQTRLEGANFWEARLEGGHLWEARLEGAKLTQARLEGANLVGARLEGANLWEARLEGADIWATRLQGAMLSRARLEGTHLRRARLEGALLFEARLEGANLRGARLEEANLEEVQFEGALLNSSTNLSRASLAGVRFRSVDLSQVLLSAEQIASAFGDGSVILPGGVTPGHPDWPAHWPDRELSWQDYNRLYDRWQATLTPPP